LPDCPIARLLDCPIARLPDCPIARLLSPGGPVRTNYTREKLEAGKVVFGAIVSECAPGMVELLGKIGYDFVFIDCEHGAIDLSQVEHLVRAAELFDITPIVRVPDHAPSTLLRYLDRGAQGLIVPHVNTQADAIGVARASRYYPEGNRGAAGGRPHDYNVGVSREQSAAWLNRNLLVIPMVEEVEAIENLDAILAVEGIDVLHVASGDLSQSMGYPPAEEVRGVMQDVVGRIRAAGKHAGVGGNSATDPEGVAELVRAGANFVTIQSTGLLRLGAESFRREVEGRM
jgi:4-hydroxy-2-oxoheptanedioate aldolase